MTSCHLMEVGEHPHCWE